jgi:hypothetical protein
LTDAETGLNTISLSAITSECRQEGNCVTTFTPVGVDFVVNAGQTTKLFEQVQAKTESVAVVGPTLEQKFEQMQTEMNTLKAKLVVMEQVQPATVAASVVKMEQALTNRGINLEQFHDEFLKKQG